MSRIVHWLTDHSQIVVEALLHSLWISSVVGLLVWLALRQLSVKHSNLRYAIALSGLLLTVVGTFAAASSVHRLRSQPVAELSQPEETQTGVSQVNSQSESVVAERATTSLPPSSNSKAIVSTPTPSKDGQGTETAVGMQGSVPSVAALQWQEISRWLLMVWMIGVGLMVLRTLNALLGLRQLQRASEVGDGVDLTDLQAMANHLCERMQLRRLVTLVMNANTTHPAVLGFFKPVILIPPAMMTGIPPEHWQLILAHELAHVRRFDAIVNLMQMLIESALFFNPAVWWISRQVRIEREACCDAMAAKVTGQSIEFARMLLNVASGDWQHNATQASAAIERPPAMQTSLALTMSLADETHSGSVRDRVTRLADPNRKSAPRFTKAGLAVAFLALIGTGFALQRGTDFAVQKVAELMTPAERVETLARLQAEQSGVFVKSGTANGAAATEETDSNVDAVEAPKTMFEVKIIVRTNDGEPVPKGLLLRSTYHTRRNSTSSYSSSGTVTSGIDEGVPVYETSVKLPQSEFVIGGSAPGYAAFATAPRTIYEAADAAAIEITLTKGFDAKVVVQNEDGQPIPGAALTGGALVKLDGSSTGANSLQEVADADGAVQLTNCGELLYSLRVRAAGYQHESFEVHVQPDAPTLLTLKKARPTILKVVDDGTGELVRGAVCVEQFRETKSSNNSQSMWSTDPRDRPRKEWVILSESDSDGIMSVDQMRDDMKYTVAISAEGYGTFGISNLEAGIPEREIRLHKPITVSGRITGNLTQLQKDRSSPDKFTLRYRNPLGGEETRTASILSTTVDAEGRFVINDIVRGVIEFDLPGSESRQRITVTDSMDDVELQIAAPQPMPQSDIANVPMRDVVLRLTGVNKTAAARGFLRVSWHGAEPGLIQPGTDEPFVDNQIKLSVPVGVPLRYEAHGMVGYFVELKGQSVNIEAGSGAQVIDIPAEPAGAVHGQLIGVDGQPAAGGFINAYPASVSWLESWNGDAKSLNPSSQSGGSKFFRSLPFGGTYVVFARMTNADSLQWAVSEPFTIDGAHPVKQLDLQLQAGKPVTIRLQGQDGNPITTADVEFTISMKCEGITGTSSFSLITFTNSNGIARFASAMPEDSVGPLTITGRVSVSNVPRHIGFSAELSELSKRDGVYELSLQPAVSASGILIDAATGRPVPNAAIRVYPRDFEAASFKQNIRTTSDAKGKFHFNSLEPIEYTGHVDGAAIKGTKITMLPGGGYQMKPPITGLTSLSIVGGASQPVIWEVELVPDQDLKPLP